MYSYNLGQYVIWAPDEAEWTAWAKPVLFASAHFRGGEELSIPDVSLKNDRKTMVIVDLPGKQSVEEALAFASKGWRPVPLFNGVYGDGQMIVDVTGLCRALGSGADVLKTLSIPLDAPPVFLLDSNRMIGSRSPGTFDNRWCVFPQDMPSHSFISSKGIDKVVVRLSASKTLFRSSPTPSVRTDLEKVLLNYQKNGIDLFTLSDDAQEPEKYTARKLPIAGGLSNRFAVTLGLRRNATGGFGASVPEPEAREWGGGGGYYRLG